MGICSTMTPHPVSEEAQEELRALAPMFDSVYACETHKEINAVVDITSAT